MIGRFDDKTQGDLGGAKAGVHAPTGAEEPSRPGVRAPIVAKKPGNCRGSEGVQEGGDAMTKPTENQPEAVSERIKRVGEILRPWTGSNRRFGQSGC